MEELDKLKLQFPMKTRVRTPSGVGLVKGYIERPLIGCQVIVDLNFHPIQTSEFINPVVVYSFSENELIKDLKVSEYHEKFNFDFRIREHEVNHE